MLLCSNKMQNVNGKLMKIVIQIMHLLFQIYISFTISDFKNALDYEELSHLS